MMGKWMNLLAGGIAGTAARYVVSGTVYDLLGTTFPYGTLIVNLIGCFLIGVFASLSEEKFVLAPNVRLLLMAGFCGAFTTFSTFILETANLTKDGQYVTAFLNILVSVIAGLVVFKCGVLVAELL